MAESMDRDNLPQATVVRKKQTRISIVWIIPILAAVVAIGIAIQRVLSEGPTITIVFKVAEGLEAGKTFVKYKDVNIGQVTAVQLTSDSSRVEVTAKIAKSAAGLMVEDTKFWVVEPRITLRGVSGLGALLSGNYIGVEVGKSDKKQRTFTGLDTPPIITRDQPGRHFVADRQEGSDHHHHEHPRAGQLPAGDAGWPDYGRERRDQRLQPRHLPHLRQVQPVQQPGRHVPLRGPPGLRG